MLSEDHLLVGRFASTASITSILGTNWIEFVDARAISVEAETYGMEAKGSKETISCLAMATTEI